MASSSASPPALQEATENSTSAWQDDLQALFEQAKERFPDVVWEIIDDDDDVQGNGVEIWGHKGALHSRFPSYQSASLLLSQASRPS
jgi:hypothetical protein